MSRLSARLLQIPFIFWQALRRSRGKRDRPLQPRQILVVAQLLLGDALMATGLLKTLRLRYPNAVIILAVPPLLAPLYSGRPWGVVAVGCTNRSAVSVWRLIRHGPYDLAFVVGDNRYGWLALAAGARYLIGHQTTAASFANWPFDELHPYPSRPVSITELFSALGESGPTVAEPSPALAGAENQVPAATAPAAQELSGRAMRFTKADWPEPSCHPFERPSSPYVVLHVGASKRQKYWPSPSWAELARRLAGDGLTVVWSCGAGETALLDEIDPGHQHCRHAGTLDLAQVWHLLRGAAALVSPDTGIAHLARVTGTPSVVLHGPGSPLLVGPGEFWSRHPALHLASDVACRDQQRVFKRDVPWVRTCLRGDRECPQPVCMEGIQVEAVIDGLHTVFPRANATVDPL